MKVYIISGLAADERVFKYIELPQGYQPVHLPWIAPAKNETLRSYSIRMAKAIDANEPFAVLGLSMGGMIATEIANAYKPVATILFSSLPLAAQLPRRYRVMQFLRMHRIVPIRLVKTASFAKRFFTTESAEHKTILRQVVKDSDPAFIRWAMQAVLNWDNKILPPNLYHIHGSADEILPMKHAQPTHIVQKGKHLMVMTRAGELNEFLKEVLADSLKGF